MNWRHRVVAAGLGLVLAGCGSAAAPQTPAVSQAEGATATAAPSVAALQPTAAVTTLPALATALPQIDQPVMPAGSGLVAGSSGTPTAEFATAPERVRIARIGLDETLIPVGLDDDMLPIVPDHNIGWYYFSARPGDGENVVLYGHVLRFRTTPDIPAPFARLHELQVGDEITVEDEGQIYRYRVTAQVTAQPDEVSYMLPKGEERLTLISCIGELVIAEEGVSMTERLITIAEPVDS